MGLKDNSGGILLYAIVISMVISFICVSLSALTLGQFNIAHNEIKREQALNLTRAGFEYAYDLLGNNQLTGGTFNLPGHSDVVIKIDPTVPGIDPDGVTWKITVSKEY